MASILEMFQASLQTSNDSMLIFFPLESKDFHNNNPFDLVLVESNSPPTLGVVV